MAVIAVDGNLVGAVNSFNDDGSGGTNIELDQSVDLDGNGNPYYLSSDVILIEIDDADIGANGEFLEGGADGKITVLSLKINGVEQLTSPDSIKFGGGTISEMGDGYFYIEGLELAVLSPDLDETFGDADFDNGKLLLNIEEQTQDFDLNGDDTIDPAVPETGNGIFNIGSSNIVCFAKGTRIRTTEGDVPVEDLSLDDLIETMDNGPQPLRAIVKHSLDFTTHDKRHQPIELKTGCFGGRLPRKPLCLSPQHRVLIPSDQANDQGRLVAAKGLLHLDGVRQKTGCQRVDYFHIVFDRHEIVFSEGLPTESMFLGPMALRALDQTDHQRLKSYLEVKNSRGTELMEPARPFIKTGKAKVLVPRI